MMASYSCVFLPEFPAVASGKTISPAIHLRNQRHHPEMTDLQCRHDRRILMRMHGLGCCLPDGIKKKLCLNVS